MLLVTNSHLYGDAWEALDWAKARELVPSLPEEKPAYSPANLVVTYEEFITAGDLLQLHIDKGETARQLGLQLVRLEKRLGRTDSQILHDGGSVIIHVPDYTLAHIKQVEVLCDCCTDELQRHLDDGWVILAVCPPNAQRRPDYVIGRRDKSTQ